MKIIETCTKDIEFQIKNNPFVKKCPTLRTFKIIERSPEKLIMRVISKSREVPYCDCFYIEEEWYVASMPNGHNSCCFKVSFIIVFVKSTMMQSIIKSNTVSE